MIETDALVEQLFGTFGKLEHAKRLEDFRLFGLCLLGFHGLCLVHCRIAIDFVGVVTDGNKYLESGETVVKHLQNS